MKFEVAGNAMQETTQNLAYFFCFFEDSDKRANSLSSIDVATCIFQKHVVWKYLSHALHLSLGNFGKLIWHNLYPHLALLPPWEIATTLASLFSFLRMS